MPSFTRYLKVGEILNILSDLYRGQETGTLVLQRESVTKFLYIQEGQVIFAASNAPEDKFTQILMDRGKLTAEQLEMAQEKKGSRTIGKTLVELGFIGSEDLLEALIEQVRKVTRTVMVWPSGNSSFKANILPPGVAKLPVTTPRIVLDTAMGVEDREWVGKTLGGLESVYQMPSSARDALRNWSLNEEESRFLDFINGKNSIRLSCEKAGVDPYFGARLILGLFYLRGVNRSEILTKKPKGEEDGMDLSFLDKVVPTPAAKEPSVPKEEPSAEQPPPPPPDEPESAAEEPPPPTPEVHVSPGPTGGTFELDMSGDGGGPEGPVPSPMDETILDEGRMDAGPGEPPPAPEFKETILDDGEAEREDQGGGIIIPPPTPDMALPPREDGGDAEEPMTPLFMDMEGDGAKQEDQGEWDEEAEEGYEEAEEPVAKKSRKGLLTVVLFLAVMASAGIGGYFLLWPIVQEKYFSPPLATDLAEQAPPPARPPEASPTPLIPDGGSAEDPGAGSVKPPGATLGDSGPEPPPETEPVPTEPPEPEPPPVVDLGAPSDAGSARELLRAGDYQAAARAFRREFKGRRGGYTVNLEVACQPETIRKGLDAAAGSEEFAILPYDYHGRFCYLVVWGHYPTRGEAEAAMDRLPVFFIENATPRVTTWKP